MSKDLIDPLNEDTYDDRVIVHGPLKSYLSGPAFEKLYKRKFRFKRKQIWQTIRAFHWEVWKRLHVND